MTTSPEDSPRWGRPVCHNDTEYRTAKEAAIVFGVHSHTIHVWCRTLTNGWRHPWK